MTDDLSDIVSESTDLGKDVLGLSVFVSFFEKDDACCH